MNDCERLIELFHSSARDQVQLALLAETAPVATMHLDLAVFREQQARVAEEMRLNDA